MTDVSEVTIVPLKDTYDRDRKKHTERKTDRQTDGMTDRHTGRQTEEDRDRHI